MASNIEPILNGGVNAVLRNGLIIPLFNPSANDFRTICLLRSLSFSNMSVLTAKNDVFCKNIRVPAKRVRFSVAYITRYKFRSIEIDGARLPMFSWFLMSDFEKLKNFPWYANARNAARNALPLEQFNIKSTPFDLVSSLSSMSNPSLVFTSIFERGS